MVKISFLDFWDGFQPDNNFFLYLMKDIYGHKNVSLTSPQDSDLLFYSCFGNQSHHSIDRGRTKKIYYTGENLRPNYNECDYSLTFDFDPYQGKNVRLPLWMLQIDFYNKKNYENPKFVLPLDEVEDNKWIRNPKTEFCATIFNHDKANNRMSFVKQLSEKYKPVHCWGKPFNNWFYGENGKYEILQNFKFSMCFENAIFPGYYTEKLFHAKTSGTVPIYYADENCKLDFNTKSFINFNDFSSMDELVDYVKKVDENEELYKSYFNESLFHSQPSLDKLKEEVKGMLNL